MVAYANAFFPLNLHENLLTQALLLLEKKEDLKEERKN